MKFAQQITEALIQAPKSISLIRKDSFQWLAVYFLAGGFLFSFFIWQLLENEAAIKAAILDYFFPKSWHGVSESLGEYLFNTQTKTVIANAILAGSLVFASMFLFPIKEKYSATFEKESGLSKGSTQEFPLWMQGWEEVKLFLFYLTAQLIILWIGYYPYLWAKITSISLSYLFLFFTFGLDFISPTLQRHRKSYSLILKVFFKYPWIVIAFGLLFSLPVIGISQIVFAFPELTLIEMAGILFISNLFFLTLAVPAGTRAACALMPTVDITLPPEKKKKFYGYSFMMLTLIGMLFLHGGLIASLHHKSQLLSSLQQELNEKSTQLKEFNKAKAEVEKLKREKEELKDSVEAESARKLNEQLVLEKEKIHKVEYEKNQLNLKEKEQVIEQLKAQIEIVKRKAEQGSMQLQGEVQELAIEQWLAEHFPLDSIDEIKKGARGADCLQTVNTHSRKNCGSIYYESKRTQNFQPSWIEKFKADIREKGADIGVLVTEAMPSDMNRMGLKEGIWICTFDEFKGLCLVLRESVIKMSQAIAIQDNKGDKMSMLYDFLTGNEFRMQVEAIVEGFTQMQDDLVKEKRAMNSIWKKREKQIEKVLLNTTDMYSSVQGIAGSAVKSLPLLELGGGDGEE